MIPRWKDILKGYKIGSKFKKCKKMPWPPYRLKSNNQKPHATQGRPNWAKLLTLNGPIKVNGLNVMQQEEISNIGSTEINTTGKTDI